MPNRQPAQDALVDKLDLGFKGIPVYNVENACASGATGVHLARHALLAQQYDTVLVFGIEQLTALGGGTIPLQRNDHKTDLYAKAGMVLPAAYPLPAQARRKPCRPSGGRSEEPPQRLAQ